jgi:hypothetical protein
MTLHRWDLGIEPVYVQTSSDWVNKQHRVYEGYMISTQCTDTGGLYPYDGSQTYTFPGANLIELPFSPSLAAMGTIGWAKYKPTAPKGSAGTALAELISDGIPKPSDLVRIAQQVASYRNWKRQADGASGAFLGHQFALVPLLKDIKEFISNIRKVDQNIKQLARDNGKPVRRRGLVRKIESNRNYTQDGGSPSGSLYPTLFFGHYSNRNGTLAFTEKDTTEYYFSGEFTYWLDPKAFGFTGLSDKRTYQLERILLGLDPTDPSMWYSAIPWTWLFEWFIPVGKILSNLNDSADNLVARYAYISGHRKRENRATRTFYLNDEIERSTSSWLNAEVRTRIPASPYGFGLSFTDFNLKQLAILAALGWQKLT